MKIVCGSCAVHNLNIKPEFVLVDGNHLPSWDYSAKSIVRGDIKIPEIAAASIIAKVSRDAEMVQKDLVFPEYGFFRNKGYLTSLHLTALNQFGPCAIHRRSFAPVSKLLGWFLVRKVESELCIFKLTSLPRNKSKYSSI